MTEIRFYHLMRQQLDQALPGLLSKALQTGKNIILKAIDEKHTEHLNEMLWTYHADSFLPHGTIKDGSTERQPVFITADTNNNPNNAKIMVITDSTSCETPENYDLCCHIFDGHDTQAVSNARTLWKNYKENEKLDLTYWQQNDQGGWEKKQ
jgi:DNA polymerase-3 subunit chi